MGSPHRSSTTRITGTELVLGSLAIILGMALWALIATVRQDVQPSPPNRVMSKSEAQTARFLATRALLNYTSLRASEQNRIYESLARHLTDVESWMDTLADKDAGIVCLGENHGPAVRTFLAERFFPHFPADALYLETTHESLLSIEQSLNRNRRNVSLLGADIGGIIDAARSANPAVELIALEGERTLGDDGQPVPRERDLAGRFWQHYRPGERNVLLYGGLHCADQNFWLYHQLKQSATENIRNNMHAIRFAAIEQHAAISAFADFIRLLGLGRDSFVINDTNALRREWGIRHLFPLLDQQFLAPFDTIVIYGIDRTDAASEKSRSVLSAHSDTSRSLHEVRLTPRGEELPHWSGPE